MNKILNKLFSYSKNFDSIGSKFEKIRTNTHINKIFTAIEEFSEKAELRYVGGCVRKVLNNEIVDDIDLAVNLSPTQVAEALKKNSIKYFETGIKHGTITAVIDKNKFEITSLRKDIKTDGRHAKVEFLNDWKEDASRRDFSINSIYADINGNLFDPYDGKKDLENGDVKFIGEVEKRIKEDYLRILRYIRFFLNYSKKNHDLIIIKTIKKNLDGVSKISSDRLLDEFRKLAKSKEFLKLTKDKFCLEIINLIFPQFVNLNIFKNLNSFALKNMGNLDFIFLVTLMIIDGKDNADYFIYKFNISKNDKKRILFLNNIYSKKINSVTFSKKNLEKILYFHGKQSLLDLLYFQIFKLKKIDNKLIEMLNFFKEKEPQKIPVKASDLISKYNIPEGRTLGKKLKMIEEIWVNNNFNISEKQIQRIVKS